MYGPPTKTLIRPEGLFSVSIGVVERTAKPTFTKPAPPDVRREIAERCDAVIEALAD